MREMISDLLKVFKNKNREIIFDGLTRFWEEIGKNYGSPMPEKYLTNTVILDLMAQNKNTLFIIINAKTLELLYFSPNIEEFSGYSVQEIQRHKLRMAIKTMSFEQLPFFMHIANWHKALNKKMPHKSLLEHQSAQYGGLKFQRKDGKVVKLLAKLYPLEMDENGFCLLIFYAVRDVSHLLKIGEYWARFECGLQEKHFACFANNKANLMADLFSDREKEVLKLVAENLESKEIAERLFISVNTVDKHRRNMIARIGARDSIALVEICKICNIV